MGTDMFSYTVVTESGVFYLIKPTTTGLQLRRDIFKLRLVFLANM